MGCFFIKNQINDNNGGWNAGASGVTDAGLLDLLGSFTFNNDGTVGSNQTFTLRGLTAGQDYKFTSSHVSGTTLRVSRTLTSLRMVKLHHQDYEDHPELEQSTQQLVSVTPSVTCIRR